ncbi:hypothetical protein TNCV_1004591 [Trichonephila clavipes]|nr:hypothetical protein TNCV_1004591 [Trichonephila clavipes]
MPTGLPGHITVNYNRIYGAMNNFSSAAAFFIDAFASASLISAIFAFILSDEAHFWLNGYVNKQNCHIWSEANPQVYAETPLHPEKLTVWCALWAGGNLLQKR